MNKVRTCVLNGHGSFTGLGGTLARKLYKGDCYTCVAFSMLAQAEAFGCKPRNCTECRCFVIPVFASFPSDRG